MSDQFASIREALAQGLTIRWADDTVRRILEALDVAERRVAESEQQRSANHETWNRTYDRVYDWLTQATAERDALRTQVAGLQKLVDYPLATINAITRELATARVALEIIREATSLALPSEQTGPEWEWCVRVPIARMAAIDTAVAGVLGEPAITSEVKP